jgi:hypothetical protein
VVGVVVDVAAVVVTVMDTDDVMPARRARVVLRANSSLSSVVVSAVGVVLLLLKLGR